MIGGNRELTRLLPAVSLHIVHAKYHLVQLQRLRLVDYKEVAAAITKNDAPTAAAAFRKHNENVRQAILEQAKLR
jgi:DNA-binding FadR family transcriptional regulator